jgi:hypothetical protein
MTRESIHDHPVRLWNRVFVQRGDIHIGRFPRRCRFERDPPAIRRQPRVRDRPFGIREEFTLLPAFGIDDRQRVQAREPLDDQQTFVQPLARPPAAIVSQDPPRARGRARDEDRSGRLFAAGHAHTEGQLRSTRRNGRIPFFTLRPLRENAL